MRVDAIVKRRVRGVILKLVLQKHERQEHRYDDYTLLAALDRLSFELYLDIVREILQDMEERDLIAFEERKNRKTGETAISKIHSVHAAATFSKATQRTLRWKWNE